LGFTSVIERHGSDALSRTVLSRRRHEGPLRVQKPLYPEGVEICHAIVLHPPAGVVGGDELELEVRVGAGAHATISTPSATKWYKTNGRAARQTTQIVLGPGAKLDWLPEENLFFDQAHANLRFELRADPSAAAIGWDVTMLGRSARGERFRSGDLGFRSRIERAGEVLWCEQARIRGGDGLLELPTGMANRPVLATLWALGSACTAELAESLAPHLPWSDELRAGSTSLPGGILLVRVLGHAVEPVRTLLERLWAVLRPRVLGRQAQPLRLWSS
jgi:urease accessory protein